MGTWLQDFRYAFRMLYQNTGFAATVILTVGLTIGISTVVFSVVDAVLIRPLPYKHPEEIYSLHPFSPQGYAQPASYPEYLDWRRENHVFTSLAAVNSFGSANLEGPSGAVPVPKVMTSDNFFDVFGVAPFLGRTFAAGEEQPGRNDVAVLSYEMWQQNFGGQANAVGQVIKLDARPYTVVGVMPASFRYPLSSTSAIYIPLHMSKELAKARGSHWLPTLGRLKPGISREQAQADIDRVLEQIGAAYPEQSKGRKIQLWTLSSSISANARQSLKVLIFAVLTLLAIGCVNVAGLLLVRGVKREREIAVRSAVGASRLRISWQILTETLVLGLLGAVLGIVFAQALLDAIRKLLIASMERGAEVHINNTALVLAVALAVLTSVFAGLIPALRMSSIAPQSALKIGGGAGASRGQHRLRAAFIVTQLALALVLLVTSGLLLRVLYGLRNADLGFNPDQLVAAEINLSRSSYEQRDLVAAFFQPMLERVQQIPGVKAAGLVGLLPIRSWGWNSDVHVVGQPPDPPNEERLAETRPVTPGYFAALGIPLLRGRLIDDKIDTRTSARVVVVNEAFVKKFLPDGGDPIGKFLDWSDKPMIVGVVRSIRQDISEPPLAEIDFPVSQVPVQEALQYFSSMQLVVRMENDSVSVIPGMRRIFRELDPGLPFRQPVRMHEVIADALVMQRLQNWLFGTFAALAVLLAVVGLYGLISHEIELSTRDIGIRVALGATRLQVLTTVYRRVLIMLGSGIVAGLFATAAVRRVITAVVEVHAGKDAPLVAGLAAGFAAMGLLSVLVPARRATHIEPMEALRYE